MSVKQEISYWLNYFDFYPINLDDTIEYVIENYVKNQKDVVSEYIEVMEIKIPTVYILNYDKICEMDDDYVKIGEDMYLNIYTLSQDYSELQQNGLIK